MIEKYILIYEQNKHLLREKIEQKKPENYKELVRYLAEILKTDEYESIDPGRIHEINDGDYQGTLIFVIPAGNFQPSKYFFMSVDYGSCSGCDTFYRIEAEPEDKQTDQFMTLALHLLQSMKET